MLLLLGGSRGTGVEHVPKDLACCQLRRRKTEGEDLWALRVYEGMAKRCPSSETRVMSALGSSTYRWGTTKGGSGGLVGGLRRMDRLMLGSVMIQWQSVKMSNCISLHVGRFKFQVSDANTCFKHLVASCRLKARYTTPGIVQQPHGIDLLYPCQPLLDPQGIPASTSGGHLRLASRRYLRYFCTPRI